MKLFKNFFRNWRLELYNKERELDAAKAKIRCLENALYHTQQENKKERDILIKLITEFRKIKYEWDKGPIGERFIVSVAFSEETFLTCRWDDQMYKYYAEYLTHSLMDELRHINFVRVRKEAQEKFGYHYHPGQFI